MTTKLEATTRPIMAAITMASPEATMMDSINNPTMVHPMPMTSTIPIMEVTSISCLEVITMANTVGIIMVKMVNTILVHWMELLISMMNDLIVITAAEMEAFMMV